MDERREHDGRREEERELLSLSILVLPYSETSLSLKCI